MADGGGVALRQGGVGRGSGSGAALAQERWCRAGGVHVASRGAKRREWSGTRERKEGAGKATGGTVPGVGPAC
jgi:hypothetical protein